MLALGNVSLRFPEPFFHEVVFELPKRAANVLAGMSSQQILGGYDLGLFDNRLENCLLVNVTETKTGGDIEQFVQSLSHALE